MKQTDPIHEILAKTKTIAVVGLSDSPMRPSYGVSSYMQSQGYKIVPVNPQVSEALGEKSYPSLMDIPSEVAGEIDMVNVFRRSEYVDEIAEQTIALKIPALWLQEDVINERAAAKARRAGIFVVMDLCILKEHHKLK